MHSKNDDFLEKFSKEGVISSSKVYVASFSVYLTMKFMPKCANVKVSPESAKKSERGGGGCHGLFETFSKMLLFWCEQLPLSVRILSFILLIAT